MFVDSKGQNGTRSKWYVLLTFRRFLFLRCTRYPKTEVPLSISSHDAPPGPPFHPLHAVSSDGLIRQPGQDVKRMESVPATVIAERIVDFACIILEFCEGDRHTLICCVPVFQNPRVGRSDWISVNDALPCFVRITVAAPY